MKDFQAPTKVFYLTWRTSSSTEHDFRGNFLGYWIWFRKTWYKKYPLVFCGSGCRLNYKNSMDSGCAYYLNIPGKNSQVFKNKAQFFLSCSRN
jgi:hypothetical protein